MVDGNQLSPAIRINGYEFSNNEQKLFRYYKKCLPGHDQDVQIFAQNYFR